MSTSIKVDDATNELINEIAKAHKLEPSEAVAKLVKHGFSRVNALINYANKVAESKPAKEKKPKKEKTEKPAKKSSKKKSSKKSAKKSAKKAKPEASADEVVSLSE